MVLVKRVIMEEVESSTRIRACDSLRALNRGLRAAVHRRLALRRASRQQRGMSDTPNPQFLGKQTDLPSSPEAAKLDYVPNPRDGTLYLVRFAAPEFTSLCPVTGQPDFAQLTLEYVPDALCVELKSLKLYIWSYRDDGAFHEAVTNKILDDIVATCQPRFARLRAKFNVRGGTYPEIVAEYRAPDWRAPQAVELP